MYLHRWSASPLGRSLFVLALMLLAGGTPARADGGTITVHVANPYGVADAGATVYAGPPGTTVATCTLQGRCGTVLGTTDAAGDLTATPTGAGPLVLCAVAPTSSLDRDIGCTDPLTPAPGATISIIPQSVPPTPFRGTQAGSGAIALLVRDQDGRPLPNTPVLLGSARATFGAYETRADGSLTFENVAGIDAPCAYVFSSQTEQFAQSGCLEPITVAAWGSVVATLRLTAGGGATVQMQLGAVVFTVVDPSGHPMPAVFISIPVEPQMNMHYWTDAHGRFSFLQPAGVPSRPIEFEPGDPYGNVTIGPLTVQPGEIKEVTVTASPAVPAPQPPASTAPRPAAEADSTLPPLPCRFVLGFQALHAAIPVIVGDCLDDEQHNPANGDALQHTTNGLLVWRKLDNFTAFTDGYRTWVNGPDGVQERLNTQRFAWEANPGGLPVVP